MRVLALDTTTRAGSVALVVDDRLVEERIGDPSRGHAERLPAEIVDVVAAHGLALGDMDLFAVATGPGSFTGLRIGIATIQGAAFVHGRSVVGIPALEALAHIAADGRAAGALVGAWMDAHRHEVFSALYRVTAAAAFESDRLTEIDAPTAGEPAALLARWRAMGQAPDVFVGDGADMYRAVVGDAAVAGAPAIAGAIGRMATARARRGAAIAPAALHPFYVRRTDAEILRDKKGC